jgi:hypothetical protein
MPWTIQVFVKCYRDSTFGLVLFFWVAVQPLWAPAVFQFPDLFTIGRTPWTSDQLVGRPLPKHRTTQTQNTHKYKLNIRAGSGIQTHDHSVRDSEDSSCFRLLGYRDRPALCLPYLFYQRSSGARFFPDCFLYCIYGGLKQLKYRRLIVFYASVVFLNNSAQRENALFSRVFALSPVV